MTVQRQDRKADAAAVSVKGLGKTFGDKVAFADVSFEIRHGEVFGFLGPNGAGKTTTVRTLRTLIAPTPGRGAGGALAHRGFPARWRDDLPHYAPPGRG